MTRLGITRRKFLQISGGAIAASGMALEKTFGQPSLAAQSLPIFDTHQHLWDTTKFRLPWQASEDLQGLRRSFLMSDYLEATQGQNVVKTIYMEVDVAPDQQLAEANQVIQICERGDSLMKAAVISGRLGTPAFEPYIRHLAKNTFVKGVRQVLHGDATPSGFCLQPKFVESIQLLGDLGLCFDLCLRSEDILGAVGLVDQCPKTRFVIDHCGNMKVTSTDRAARARWLEGMTAMAARKNTVCKVSGIVASANKVWTADDLAPNINDTINAFGDDRVMFAGDWPVCTLRATFSQWVEALKHIVSHRSITFQKKLFHDNAAIFYGV